MDRRFPERESDEVTLSKLAGTVNEWRVVRSLFPQEISQQDEVFLKTYFDATLAVAEQRKAEAGHYFDLLDEDEGFQHFQEKNPGALAAVEVLVRGRPIDDLVTPSLRVKSTSQTHQNQI